MMKKSWMGAVLGVMMVMAAVAPLRADEAAKAGTEEVLYEDATGQSSAKITQVLPDASKTLLTLDNVRRVRIKHDILIVEWGNTLTTLLPKHFVMELSINKRNAPAPAK